MKYLDERQFSCPLPVVHTKNELSQMKAGEVLSVKVNDTTKRDNIKRLSQTMLCECEVKTNSEDDIDLIITVSEDTENALKSAKCTDCRKTVVVVSSRFMGQGDETLGQNLMKAFIFALTKQDSLPDAILFYNSGVFLTTEGSDCLEDLSLMEKAGVEIFSCGTCLDFYHKKELLKVGKVTNMYDIVSTMEQASIVIKP